jgi:hypothetical protein
MRPSLLRPIPTLSLALLLLLTGCAGYEPWRKDYADEQTRWGEAVVGLQVGIARRTYEAGKEPAAGEVYYLVQMRNVGPAAIKVLAPVEIDGTPPEPRAGDESACVRLTYESAAAGVKSAEFKSPWKPAVQVMEPGKDYNLTLRLSPGKFGLRRFDEGTLRATYANAQASIRYGTTGGNEVAGLWTGEAASGAVELPATEAVTAAAATRQTAPR